MPALTIAFVDSLAAKDRLNKEARDGYFTGFATGLAYSLLDQNDKFEALYWFDTVGARYAAERRALQEGSSGASAGRGGPREDANSLALKRAHSYETEFELLECAFCSARIFFH